MEKNNRLRGGNTVLDIYKPHEFLKSVKVGSIRIDSRYWWSKPKNQLQVSRDLNFDEGWRMVGVPHIFRVFTSIYKAMEAAIGV